MLNRVPPAVIIDLHDAPAANADLQAASMFGSVFECHSTSTRLSVDMMILWMQPPTMSVDPIGNGAAPDPLYSEPA